MTREDIFAVFDIYKPPLRGMDWWRLFTIDHFNRVGGDYDANFVIDYFNLGNALPVIASNQRLMKWIKTKRLHTLICVDAFSGAKSALWDTKLDQPRRDSVAKDVLKYIQKHPGISRPDLRGYIKTLE